VVDDLKTRINALSGKTTAAKLRDVMPDIDRKVREGVRHEDIIQTLGETGLKLSLATFRGNLYRYRRLVQSIPEPELTQDQAIAQIFDSPPMNLEDVLDARQRETIEQKYVGKRPPIIGHKRNQT
jgi:hypothetical protein